MICKKCWGYESQYKELPGVTDNDLCTCGIGCLDIGLDMNPLSVFAKECSLGAYTPDEMVDAARLALRRAMEIPQPTQETCNWIQDDDDGNWVTDCGGIFVIIDGTPRDNEMKFCPYCSNRITEHPYMGDEND